MLKTIAVRLGLTLSISLGFWAYASPAPISCEPFLAPKSGISRASDDFRMSTYLTDTLASLEAMRGLNGLLADTIMVTVNDSGLPLVEVLNPDTSPTNIAVDLLIQAEKSNVRNLSKIIKTLSQLEYHQQTGLFFSRYTTDSKSTITDFAVSSIDNLHLAIALFTIQEKFPQREIGRRARQMFARMNFSVFYEPTSGLIGGNLRHANGQWFKEEYNFTHFGSEARLLYSAGWALGLFRDYGTGEELAQKSIAAIKFEMVPYGEDELLKLWDGSAFQLFFPMIFMAEQKYSPRMKSVFSATADLMISEGVRRGLGVPAAHSAGRASIHDGTQEPTYKDKAGDRSLVSADNNDLNDPRLSKSWDSTFAPYALFMAAAIDPDKFKSTWRNLETISSGGNRLYVRGMGWMDGLHVSGPYKGQVVPAQLALNQGMIALSLLQMQSADGMNVGARAMFENPQVHARLSRFYAMIARTGSRP